MTTTITTVVSSNSRADYTIMRVHVIILMLNTRLDLFPLKLGVMLATDGAILC